MVRKVALSILTGVLLSLAWTQWGLAWLLPVAFIPLLLVENEVAKSYETKKGYSVLLFSYLSFLTWNIISTWWVAKAIIGGGIAANTLNSLFFALIFTFFHHIKQKMGKHTGYSALIILWVAFEKLYLDGEISWPWLTLGNGFANNTDLVQWYEYTGILGGSVWILLCNVVVFNLYTFFQQYHKINIPLSILTLILFIAPPVTSFNIKSSIQIEDNEDIKVSIIQPNIDPYNGKFNHLTQAQQLDIMLDLMENESTQNSSFFILPETAIDDDIIENDLSRSKSINRLKTFIKEHPQSNIIVGATSYFFYPNGTDSPTCRENSEGKKFDAFNTALQINNTSNIDIYHKSKLVIGAEKTPYPKFFNFLKRYAFDLGGISGNLGTQKERSVFSNSYNSAVIAPVICYESIYGEFVGEYIKKGANVIFTITNDGWWGDTQGYKQHFSYSKLRAIETRRFVVRCANTGISSIISPSGEVLKQTPYWEKAVINGSFKPQNKITFYTETGDAIGRIIIFLAVLLLLYYFSFRLKERNA